MSNRPTKRFELSVAGKGIELGMYLSGVSISEGYRKGNVKGIGSFASIYFYCLECWIPFPRRRRGALRVASSLIELWFQLTELSHLAFEGRGSRQSGALPHAQFIVAAQRKLSPSPQHSTDTSACTTSAICCWPVKSPKYRAFGSVPQSVDSSDHAHHSRFLPSSLLPTLVSARQLPRP